MSEGFKLLISLSISATLISLIIFALKPFIKSKLSKAWQYYIWIIVIIRLLVPFSVEKSIVNTLFISKSQIISFNKSITLTENSDYNTYSNQFDGYDDTIQIKGDKPQNFINLKFIISNLLYISLIISALLITKHLTTYLSFIKYIKAGRKSIKDEEILDLFFETATELNLKIMPNLYSHKLITSSMAIGVIKPFVVVPENQIQNKENLKYIFLHELTHIKRFDVIYKWILDFLICIHWFNPILYLIKKDINSLCELSCDESVIKQFDEADRKCYGDTILKSIQMSGNYSDGVVSNLLCEDGKLIKERLKAIMNFNKKSKVTVMISTIITCSLLISAIVTGAYTGTALNNSNTKQTSSEINIINNDIQQNEAKESRKSNYTEDEDNLSVMLPFMSQDKVESLADNYLSKTGDISDISSFLPFMSRDKIDSLADNYLSKTGDIDDISSFLPFMSRDKVESLADNYLSKIGDIDDISSFLPFMSRDKVESLADNYLSKIGDIDDISSFLPFMSRNKIDSLVDNHISKTGDISDIKSFLPFMSRDKIDSLVDNHISKTGDISDIKSFLPFMSRNKIDSLVDKHISKTGDIDDISSFLPFMSRDKIDSLVDNHLSKTGDISDIKSFLPFMSRDKIDSLVDNHISKTGDISDIKSFLPFMSRDKIDSLVDNHISKTGDISDIKSFLPFMSRDKIDSLVDNHLSKTGDISAISSFLPFMSRAKVDSLADKYGNFYSSSKSYSNNYNYYDNQDYYSNNYDYNSDYYKSLEESFSQYKKYGLEYKDGSLSYNGKQVRWFVDDKFISNAGASKDAKIDVIAIRENGKLVGLRESTKEEFDNQTLVPLRDKYYKSETESTEPSDKSYYSEYEKYGLEYKDNNLFYNGKKVRWFVDDKPEGKIASSPEASKDAKIDVIAIRENGELVGLRESTKEEFDNQTFVPFGDKYDKPETESTEPSKGYRLANFDMPKYIDFDDYSEYGEFSFDSQKNIWYLNDKPLKLFYDDLGSEYIILYYTNKESLLKSGIAVKVVVNSSGKKELTEMTESELNTIYSNKAFKGMGYPFT